MIVIATPVKDITCAGYTYDLAQMLCHEYRAGRFPIYTISPGVILCNQRELLAQVAVDQGASHVLFVDSDIRFPPDALHLLMDRSHDIIGANYLQRTQIEWTARKDGEFVSSEGSRTVQSVDTIGLGLTLIRAEVFKALSHPWFDMPWDAKSGKHTGEDVYFCGLARRHGFKVFVDHDLSQHVRHIGSVEFGPEEK